MFHTGFMQIKLKLRKCFIQTCTPRW